MASEAGIAPYVDSASRAAAPRRAPPPPARRRAPPAHPHTPSLPPAHPAATVSVITNDGRHIVGTLRGYDQATNLILDDSHERVYSEGAGAEAIALGLYVVRGDNMCVRQCLLCPRDVDRFQGVLSLCRRHGCCLH
jgi:small nuclear ribonucleoprotein (snRNP)-like protein